MASTAPTANGEGPSAAEGDPDPAVEPPASRAGRRAAAGWLPESLRGARLDPGHRGALVAVAAAVVAATAAAAIAWHAKPVERPLANGLTTSVATSFSASDGSTAGTGDPLSTPSVAASSAGAGATAASPAALVVSVVGRVRRPGLVRLPPGARVNDAVHAAGGALRPGDLGLLNLAAPLADGMQVVVGGASSAVESAPAPAGPPAAAGTGPVPASGVPTAPVDLNTAGLAELDALPGVGPVTAQKILDWRSQHDRFTSVDDLREIAGIGEAKFAQIAPHVKV